MKNKYYINDILFKSDIIVYWNNKDEYKYKLKKEIRFLIFKYTNIDNICLNNYKEYIIKEIDKYIDFEIIEL